MTRGVIIHAVLLTVMLVYGYRAWTAEETISESVGDVSVWNRSAEALSLITYETQSSQKDGAGNVTRETTTRLEIEKRKDANGEYWWGTETKTVRAQKRAAPKVTPPAGVPANPHANPHGAGGPHGSKPAPPTTKAKAKAKKKSKAKANKGAPAKSDQGNKSGTAIAKNAKAAATAAAGASSSAAGVTAAQTPPPEWQTTTTTTEFPLSPDAASLARTWADLKALVALGQLSEERTKEYGLNESKSSISLTFGGEEIKLMLGERVAGSQDRYVLDTNTGKAYSLAGTVVNSVAGGRSALALSRFNDAKYEDLSKVVIRAQDKSLTIKPITEKVEIDSKKAGQKSSKVGWTREGQNKLDDGLGTFFNKVHGTRPKTFEPALDPSQMTALVSMEYFDKSGASLGTVELFKQTAADAEPSPVAAPTTKTTYYGRSTDSRALAEVRKDIGEFVEQNLGQLMQ